MGTYVTALKAVRVILEYGMLLWLLYFITSLVRVMFKEISHDCREGASPKEHFHGEAVLVLFMGEGAHGQRFPVRQRLSIGRAEDNDIVLSDPFVSHHHVLIYRQENQYAAEDLSSRNHTYVNDSVLMGRTYLHGGDVLRIGTVSLRFER